MAVAVAAVKGIFRKNFLKGNPGLPKCKPCAVYIYEVLIKNGDKDQHELSRKTYNTEKTKRPDTDGIG